MNDTSKSKPTPKPTTRELQREAQRLARVRLLDERRRRAWSHDPDPDPKEAA
jgi:hypothetical protein